MPPYLMPVPARSCPSVHQVSDIGTVVPKNSVVEANQSGLIAEPLLDITPQVSERWHHIRL